MLSLSQDPIIIPHSEPVDCSVHIKSPCIQESVKMICLSKINYNIILSSLKSPKWYFLWVISNIILWKWLSCGKLSCGVSYIFSDVSEVHIYSIIRAMITSEISVSLYQTTRWNIPEYIVIFITDEIESIIKFCLHLSLILSVLYVPPTSSNIVQQLQ